MNRQNSDKQEAVEKTGGAWKAFLSEIKERCLNRNFGTLSKSEFDLMLFHYYLENLEEEVGSRYVSDFDIGRKLGLTIQRVRSLRERNALKWGTKGNWKESFLGCLQFARCDGNGDVKIPVPDINVIKEIRNYLENLGLFDDYQLNPKVFQCNLEALVAICLDLKSGHDDNLCGRILDKLRDSKDGKVGRIVDEQEHPIRAVLQKSVIKSVQDSLALIPGIGNASGELVAGVLEKLR